jgi:chromosome segregation ATPase
MDPVLVTALGAVVVSVIGSSYQYRTSKRQASGNVNTADARTIFEASARNYDQAVSNLAQSDAIRKELVDELTSVRQEVSYLRAENAAMRQELAGQSVRLGAAETSASEARAHIERCEKELARMKRGQQP